MKDLTEPRYGTVTVQIPRTWIAIMLMFGPVGWLLATAPDKTWHVHTKKDRTQTLSPAL